MPAQAPIDRLVSIGRLESIDRLLSIYSRFVWPVIFIVIFLTPIGAAQAQAILQEFFVPISEAQIKQLAQAVNTIDTGDLTPPNPDTVHTVISISATSDNTTVYIDHWEDGFEADLSNPVQGTTETLILNAGDVSVLENDVFINPRDPITILYDGQDRIGTSKVVAITRAGWRLQEGTLLAGAVEVFPTIDWGRRFELPLGEDLTAASFEYVAVSITAGPVGAVLEIDADADGTVEETRTLPPGGTTLIEGIQIGASIESTDPVEAHLLTGDRNSTFAGRWFSLVPLVDWGTSYYTPVGGTTAGVDSTVLLYNPGTSSVTVTHETLMSTIQTFTYDNTTAGTVDEVATPCAAPLIRNFTVGDSFIVGTVGLGFNATHTFRGDVQATLVSPAATRVDVILSSGDGNQNYDLTLDNASANPINDGNFDDVASPFYDRSAGPSNSFAPFAGESSNGTWSLEICDTAAGDSGTFNRAQLQIETVTGQTPVTGTVAVSAGSVVEFTMPLNSGGHFFTQGGEPFFALSAIDYNNTAADWGFTLLPETALTTTLVVGWAPGRDPGSAVNPSENGSPIWVTAVADTQVYVDFDGDSTTGALVDPDGNRYDQLLAVSELESVRIFDGNDGDQSGTRLYTLDGTLITASWGQDPATASPGAPAIDLGTTVLPITKFTIVKEGLLLVDVDGDGGIDPGDTIRYQILVTNVASVVVEDVTLIDNGLDANVTYVAQSTEVDGVALSDDMAPATVFPLDETGFLLGNLLIGQTLTVTFAAVVNDPLPPGVDTVFNSAQASNATETSTDGNETETGDPSMVITKTSNVVGDVLPGDIITYTVSVTNTSAVNQTGLKVLDQLPDRASYVAESTAAAGFARTSVSTTYDEATPGAIDFLTTCAAPLIRNITVTDTFTLTGVEFGFNADHPFRGDIQVILQSPAGTRVTVIASDGADGNANYDLLLQDGAPGAIRDGNADTTAAPFYDRTASPDNLLAAFVGETANGVWRIEMCDTFSGLDDGIYNRSRLIVRGEGLAARMKSNQAAAASPLIDGRPTNLVLASDDFELAPAQTLTVTYDVVVDDPLDINTTVLSNTAIASTLQQPFGIRATVVDPVSRGGLIGDRVWLDADGDGIQDAGEPGLGSVAVQLVDPGPDGMPGGGDDTVLETVTTDALGRYVFSHLSPGDYFVDVDAATLPTGLTVSPGTTDPSSVLTVTAEEVFLDIDFGYTNASTTEALIGDFVWSDDDGDGVQDSAEVGIGGVSVNLVDSTGAVVATTTTASDGSYLFSGVPPGDYTVEVAAINFNVGAPLDGYTATSGPQSEGNTVSDPLTVAAGDLALDVDFGFQNSSETFSITDAVWLDLDEDGVFDASESGIAGVTVSLVDDSGNVMVTTVTGNDGSFAFAGVTPGDYTIVISDGTQIGDLGGTTAPAQIRQLDVTVVAADLAGTNFGFGATATLGDRLWNDADGDGLQDPAELGLAGVTVELVDRLGVVLASTVTAADGSYEFAGLAPDLYTIRVDAGTLPAGFSLTGDPDGNPDGSTQANLVLGESNLTLDFGYRNSTLADLSGTLFDDLDSDGVEDGGDPGISGITLNLVDAAGNVVATTTSDAMGNYSFADLPDGDYTVVVTDQRHALADYSLTSGLDQIDVTISGTDVGDVDFGYARNSGTASIGDTLWLDADRDGSLGAAESGLAGVTVELYDAGADGVMGGGDDTLISTAVTDADGQYVFAGLDPGAYFVEVVEASLPAGFGETTYPVGVDPSALIALSEGEDFNDANFGYIASSGSALGDRVWYDLDGDGVQDSSEVGIGGVEVTVTGPSGTFTVTTDVYGFWSVPGLAPGQYAATVDTATLPAGYNVTPTNADISYLINVATGSDYYHLDWGFDGGVTGSIGDRVFFDTNGDGVQGSGEDGIGGVTVNLLDGGGNVVATTTTEADGSYDFVGLPAADYTVQISDIDGVLDGLNISTPPPGTIMLAAGQDFDGADFGYSPSAGVGSIGSQVWHDLDGDGFHDADEPGLEGVTLGLWLDVDGDGLITPGVDNFLRTTTTDANGEYEFTGLEPENYIVEVTDTIGVLAGMTKTTGTSGVDNNSQSDPYAVTLAVGATDTTADFGYTASVPHSISGTLFEDGDQDGSFDQPGELGVTGVTVLLYRVINSVPYLIGATVADANGDYSFPDLPDGDYLIQVDASGSEVDGFQQTTQLATGRVELLTLAGADSADHDFGFFDSGLVTNAISLASFYGDGRQFTWSTAAEVGNLGFHLHEYDSSSERWRRLNQHLIPSTVVDAVTPQSYQFEGAGSGTRVLLEDVDVRGRSRFHGPFEIGREYGRAVWTKAIDWPAIRAAHHASVRARAVLSKTAEPAVGAELRVDTTGIQRVTYESLAAAGVDLFGVLARNLALHRLGQPLPIHVEGPARFGPGSYIEFHGEALDTLYTDTNVYRLTVDPNLAARVTIDRRRADATNSAPDVYIATDRVARQREYSFAAPTGDPWFDTRLLAFSGPTAATFPLDLPDFVAGAGSLTLQVDVWGVTNFPQTPDHHVVVEVNGTPLADTFLDGLATASIEARLESDVLGDGQDQLRIVLPHDTGVAFDLVHVEGYSISYPRQFVAREDQLEFQAASRVFEVRGFSRPDVVAYRFSGGLTSRLDGLEVRQEQEHWTARFRGAPESARYVLSTADQISIPDVRAWRPQSDLLGGGPAELLIVSHPDFLDGMEPLVLAREAEGLTVRQVDIFDVYDQYSHGVVDPQALRDFVTGAHFQLGTRFLMLVGADSYDYHDYLGLGALSFIPTIYAPTDEIIFFAPTDTLFGDVDGDLVPDLAVGRLPVRTVTELDSLIKKTLEFPTAAHEETVVLATDQYDLRGRYSFARDGATIAALLPANWQVTRADVDTLGLAGARQQLLDQINGGVALTGFLGHSGPTRWTFGGLFSADDAAQLENAAQPTVVAQWGCWNTYYVSPFNETLGHRFLLSGDRGAAAVLGASTLTSAESERRLAALLVPFLIQPGTTLGDAIVAAKRNLASDVGTDGWLDTLLGWNLLGDPTLRLVPGENNCQGADADLDGEPDDCDICFGNNTTGDDDGDGVCNNADQCAGFDDSADDDGDGVANGCDVCIGDDAALDPDGDGVCNMDSNCALATGCLFADNFESGDLARWTFKS